MLTCLLPEWSRDRYKKDMRGDDAQLQPGMFTYIALEGIPTSQPLRVVRQLVDVVLAKMLPEFDGLYAEGALRFFD